MVECPNCKHRFSAWQKKRIKSRRHRETMVRTGHEFLAGQKAHTERRIEIFLRAGGTLHIERDAEGNAEAIYTATPATCQACETGHQVTWEDGHWIHLRSRHCDCRECGIYGCKPGHVKLHHGREF